MKIREKAKKVASKGIAGLKRGFAAIYALMLCILPQTVYAAGELDPTAAIGKLSTLVTSIISAAGGIFLIYSIVQLGIAYKRQDSASKADALNGVIGGIIICAAPWIVKYITGN